MRMWTIRTGSRGPATAGRSEGARQPRASVVRLWRSVVAFVARAATRFDIWRRF